MSNHNLANEAVFLFEVSTPQATADGSKVITLQGHMDADGAPKLSELLGSLLESGVRDIRLNFSQVKFISSTGIGTLIAAIGEYREKGGDVVLVQLPVDIREIFEMLDLLDYVTIV